jgi:hypothetical protein
MIPPERSRQLKKPGGLLLSNLHDVCRELARASLDQAAADAAAGGASP